MMTLQEALIAFLTTATGALSLLVGKQQIDKRRLADDVKTKVVEKELDVDRLIENAVKADREKRERNEIVIAILENTKQTRRNQEESTVAMKAIAENSRLQVAHMENDAKVQEEAFDSIRKCNTVLEQHSEMLGMIIKALKERP